MSYIEERIKCLAVKAWQRDKSKHEIKCPNQNCDGKAWGGTMVPEMNSLDVCVLECHDCGRDQHFIPKPVIDAFLERI